MITIWNQHMICVAPINEYQSFLSNPFLFLIFLVFLLKSFFPANSFLFAHLVSHVDSLSLISFFPQHGREIIYWSKGKLPMVVAIKKNDTFSLRTIHCQQSFRKGQNILSFSPNHDKMYEKMLIYNKRQKDCEKMVKLLYFYHSSFIYSSITQLQRYLVLRRVMLGIEGEFNKMGQSFSVQKISTRCCPSFRLLYLTDRCYLLQIAKLYMITFLFTIGVLVATYCCEKSFCIRAAFIG